MENSDGFLSNSKTIQRTRIVPLRWIGNLCGEFSTSNLLMAMHYDDHDDHGFAFRYRAIMWKIFNKPYMWWGTYYLVDTSQWDKFTNSESQDS
jgi:hypothetical protein